MKEVCSGSKQISTRRLTGSWSVRVLHFRPPSSDLKLGIKYKTRMGTKKGKVALGPQAAHIIQACPDFCDKKQLGIVPFPRCWDASGRGVPSILLGIS